MSTQTPVKPTSPVSSGSLERHASAPPIAARFLANGTLTEPTSSEFELFPVVRELFEKSDPDLAANTLIFPPAEVAARLKPYPALSPGDERRMQEAMAQVTGA